MSTHHPVKPINFPALASADVQLRNLLCGQDFTVNLPVTISVLPAAVTAQQAAPSHTALTVAINGLTATVTLDDTIATLLTDTHYQLGELPPRLQLALMQQVFSHVTQYLSEQLGCDVHIESLLTDQQPPLTPATTDVTLALAFNWPGKTAFGQLIVTEKLAVWLHDRLSKRLPAKKISQEGIKNQTWWSHLPIPLHMIVATSSLHPGELQNLAVNDIVLFEQCYTANNQQLQMQLPGLGAYMVSYNQNKVTVVAPLPR
jgi:hypothetical protein